MGLSWCCCFYPKKEKSDRSRSTTRSTGSKYDDRHSSERKHLRPKDSSHSSYSLTLSKGPEIDKFPTFLSKVPDPLTTYNWYYGTISRFQAQELLKNEEDGVFLVRKSSEPKTEYPYIISVKRKVPYDSMERDNFHYRIRKDENGYYSLGSNLYFKTVMDLVQYYIGRKDDSKITLKAYIDHTIPRR
ncbi:hypothetical protein WA026_012825 [Henosepilachna vigintioctopunctata]|uniref:SH2 domain-containing protein n=1 Tax=Henosepilachna vigintioctopunctata TaxID=420089 RepID=A0AAW1TJZ9_9CUCU